MYKLFGYLKGSLRDTYKLYGIKALKNT